MKKLTIGKWLYLGFGLMMFFIVILAVPNYLVSSKTFISIEKSRILLDAAELKYCIFQCRDYATDMVLMYNYKDVLDESIIKQIKPCKIEFEAVIKRIQKRNGKNEFSKAHIALEEIAKDYSDFHAKAIDMTETYLVENKEKGNVLMKKFDLHAEKLEEDIDKFIKMESSEADIVYLSLGKMAKVSIFLNTFFVIFIIIIALFLAYFITHSVVGPIVKFVGLLKEAAQQTASAAMQVSGTSQNISQGANSQATILSEVSHSIEEIDAMAKSAADNANKATILAGETKDEAEKGDVSIRQMEKAMSAINDSSNKVKKIIKTIEEIAFQTNLLALNAAVEAARAGEHGRGFAVVAEEVRNLAQRAGIAAKDSAELIEDSFVRTKDGVQIAKLSGEALVRIRESSKKTSDLVNDIASANREQAEGISQIVNAITQMHNVVQANVVYSEEGASASEELASQAQSTAEVVAELEKMSGGVEDGKGLVVDAVEGHQIDRREKKGPKVIRP